MATTRRRRILLIACIVLAGIAAGTHASYRADLRRAVAAVSTGSEVASTACGPIEYAVAGQGAAVLVVHGAGGGFDQGMLIGRELAARGFRVIAVSRFGYLRTPMPASASSETQADAHACLLDALGIREAAVLGMSAGGPSALQLAIRHPERTRALALLVPLAWQPGAAEASPERQGLALRIAVSALEHDFTYWLLTRIAPGFVTRTVLGTPTAVASRASARDKARLVEQQNQILPVSRRVNGLRVDGSVSANLKPFALDRIRAPALVISLEDDLYGTYAPARYTAAQIQGARFVGYETGGHLFVGHEEEITRTLTDFLQQSSVRIE